jgi:4'-phosphopantetheinyl transferase
MIEVYAIKIHKEIETTIFSSLLSLVHRDKQLKISRFHNVQDAERALISEILLRSIIIEKLKIKNSEIIFDKNKFGKPFLKGSFNFEFNISHSGKWVVCAIHNNPIGVDIERVLPIDFDIARRFFTESEYNILLNKLDLEKVPFFYELWTLKESYIKAAGMGLSLHLNSFSINFMQSNIEVITDNEFSNRFFKQYTIDNEYKMSVCACANDFCPNIKYKSIDEVLAEILKSGV